MSHSSKKDLPLGPTSSDHKQGSGSIEGSLQGASEASADQKEVRQPRRSRKKTTKSNLSIVKGSLRRKRRAGNIIPGMPDKSRSPLEEKLLAAGVKPRSLPRVLAIIEEEKSAALIMARPASQATGSVSKRSEARSQASITQTAIIVRSVDRKPPLPELTPEQVEAVNRHGKGRSWGKRREFGYPWRAKIFEFVRDQYRPWIPGLTQAHLKDADIELYRAFTKQVSLNGLPEWLDVPSENEASLRKVTDPKERAKREVAREVERERSQLRRPAPKRAYARRPGL